MGRYIPPSLEGVLSANQAAGKPAQKRNADGSQTVRFECPFAIWCTTCTPETIIGQGVRFNAQKKKVGNYYSTPIWAFRIKHTVCGGWIEVRTDPKNTEYVVVSGGRRRDTGEGKLLEGEFVIGHTEEDKEKDGVMGKLEAQVKDKEVANEQQRRIEELRKRQERDWADPYENNRRVRREFRVGRRIRQADERTGEALKERFGLGVDLVGVNEEDGERAKLVDFAANESGNGDRGAVSRGMFEDGGVKLVQVKEKDGRKRGKVDIVTERKSTLQSNLKGNTRIKSDPFMKNSSGWQPAARRRREEINTTNNEIYDNEDDDQLEKTAVDKAEALKTFDATTSGTTLVAYDSE